MGPGGLCTLHASRDPPRKSEGSKGEGRGLGESKGLYPRSVPPTPTGTLVVLSARRTRHCLGTSLVWK